MQAPEQLRADLRALIADYQRRVASFVAAAQKRYGRDDLLAAWRDGSIPETGMLDDPRKTRFRFHGCGCRVESVDGEVNFDFGPDGRHEGFDGWRLNIFAQRRKQEYPHFQRLEIVESVLGELVTDGEVCRPHWMPSPQLCYWTRDVGT
jgi:hypothetical protein